MAKQTQKRTLRPRQFLALFLLAMPAPAMDLDSPAKSPKGSPRGTPPPDPFVMDDLQDALDNVSSGSDEGRPRISKIREQLEHDLRMSGAMDPETIQGRLNITCDQLNQMRVVRIITNGQVVNIGPMSLMIGDKSRGSGLYATFTSGRHTYTGVLTNQHVLKDEASAGNCEITFMNRDGYEISVPTVTSGKDGFYFTGASLDANDDTEEAKQRALSKHKHVVYESLYGEGSVLENKPSQRDIDDVWKTHHLERGQTNQSRFEQEWSVKKELMHHGRDWAFVGLDLERAVQVWDLEQRYPASLALKVLGITPYNLNGREREGICGFEGINDAAVRPGDEMFVWHYAGDDYRQHRPSNKYKRDPSTVQHPKRPAQIEAQEKAAEEEMAAKAAAEKDAEMKDAQGGDDVVPQPTHVGDDKKGSGSSVHSGASDPTDEPADPFNKAPRKFDVQRCCTVSNQIKCGRWNTFIISGTLLSQEQKEEYLSTHHAFEPHKFASTTEEPLRSSVRSADREIVGDTNLAPGASGAPYFRNGQFVAIHVNGKWNNCTVTKFGGDTKHSGDLKVSGAVTAAYVRTQMLRAIDLKENKKTGEVSNDGGFGGSRVGTAFNRKQPGTNFDSLDEQQVAKLMKERLEEAKEAKKQQAIRDGSYEEGKESSYWTAADTAAFKKNFDFEAARDEIKRRGRVGATGWRTIDFDDAAALRAQRLSALSSKAPRSEEPMEDPAVAAKKAALDKHRANVDARVAALTAASTLKCSDAPADEPTKAVFDPKSVELPAGMDPNSIQAIRFINAARMKFQRGDDAPTGSDQAGSGGSFNHTAPAAFKPFGSTRGPGPRVHGFGSGGVTGPQTLQGKAGGLDPFGLGSRPGTAPTPFGGVSGAGQIVGGKCRDTDKVIPGSAPSGDAPVMPADDLRRRAAVNRLSGQNTNYLTDDGTTDAFWAQRLKQMDQDCAAMASRQTQQDWTPAPQPVDTRAVAPNVAQDDAATRRAKATAAFEARMAAQKK